jgi:hypothetical protein
MTMQCARPSGSGYDNLDQPLLNEMTLLLKKRRAANRTEAARMVAHKARGNSKQAIVDRLVRKHRELIPILPGRPRRRESASPPRMISAAEHQKVIADLAAAKRAARRLAREKKELERRLVFARTVIAKAGDALSTVAPGLMDRMTAIEAEQRQQEFGRSPSVNLN